MHGSPISLHAPPDLSGDWEIVDGGRYSAARGRDFPPHSHSDWEWVYYRAGQVVCRHGNEETFHARPGLLWLTPPETKHAEIARTAYRCDFITLRGPRASSLPRFCQDDDAGTIGRLCDSIVEECIGPRWPDRPQMLSLLSEALWRQVHRRLRASTTILPSERTASGANARRIVAAAETTWAACPGEAVARVAQRVGASAASLREHFQRVHRCSPLEYRCRRQASRALEMLQRSPELTLEAVAELCGYDSASHLSRQVKRYTGRSPGSSRAAPTLQADRPGPSEMDSDAG